MQQSHYCSQRRESSFHLSAAAALLLGLFTVHVITETQLLCFCCKHIAFRCGTA